MEISFNYPMSAYGMTLTINLSDFLRMICGTTMDCVVAESL